MANLRRNCPRFNLELPLLNWGNSNSNPANAPAQLRHLARHYRLPIHHALLIAELSGVRVKEVS